MTNEELNTELYKKLFAEQEKFKGWLLTQPPSEILNHAYEYVMREDIVLAMEATSYIDSIDRNIGEDGCTVGEKISSEEDVYENKINEITLEKVLESLDEKEKKIIFFRYFREMTQKQIASFLGTSQVQISRIEKRALQKMHDKIII